MTRFLLPIGRYYSIDLALRHAERTYTVHQFLTRKLIGLVSNLSEIIFRSGFIFKISNCQ